MSVERSKTMALTHKRILIFAIGIILFPRSAAFRATRISYLHPGADHRRKTSPACLPSARKTPERNDSGSSRLYGITEWRDAVDEIDRDRKIFMLPFRATEALVLGQAVSICLKEGRFFDLFQDCVDFHDRVLGMVLMGDDAFLDTLVLCEIEDYSVDAGFRGKVTVEVTLRAVGRATMKEIQQMKPVMMGICRELKDDEVTKPYTTASSLVDDIRSTVEALGRRNEWDQACHLVENAATSTTEINYNDDVKQIITASWAVFAIANSKTRVPDAVSLTNSVERLQLGLKVLLDDQFTSSRSESNAVQIDSEHGGGFQ